MIELVDTRPDVNVQPAEYKRLLGYPRGLGRPKTGRASSPTGRATGTPSTAGRGCMPAKRTRWKSTDGGVTHRRRRRSTARGCRRRLRERRRARRGRWSRSAPAPSSKREAQRLWQEEKPDEYFFLEVYGSAVVEHLVTMTGARLCAWAESRQLAVLPHYSPGYPEWDIAEQPRLLDVINRSRQQLPAVPVDVLESGMLRPKKSLLAVFGVTTHVDRVRRLTDLVPCENCSFPACQYRRAPYRRAPQAVNPELDAMGGERTVAADDDARRRRSIATRPTASTPRRSGAGATSGCPLQRRADGSVDAIFRYEGTTCTNMGRPLQFRVSRARSDRAPTAIRFASSTARRPRATRATPTCAAT